MAWDKMKVKAGCIMKEQVIYYQDELKDEFSEAQITAKRIDGAYRYVRTGFWDRCKHILSYRVVAEPLAWIFLKLRFHHTIKNRSVLKAAQNTGYYLYGNHTNAGADALIPSMLVFPKAASVIVHPNNVSMPVLGRITPYLGALPLPDDKEAMKHFSEALKTVIRRKNPVVIYPEAHIWPYYTDIRNFPDASFRYPVSDDVPVFCFTNTYQKKRIGFGVKIVTYVDGPFYPKEREDGQKTTGKDRRKSLRDQVYAAMKSRAGHNTVERIHYIKKETDHD
jgi:1-acyl-sn-glycerol-3-phosphate acyltransferase